MNDSAEAPGPSSSRRDDSGRRSPALFRWPAWLPPARALTLCLFVLAVYGTITLHGLSLPSLVLLPTLAAITDLGVQRIRFPNPRWPDAALATGLFLTLLLPPTVPLLAGGTVCVAAILLRHSIRYRGRPVLNPAVTGLVIGAVLFGTAPAWWVALGIQGEVLMLALAAFVLFRNLSQWRIPAAFFAIYAPFTLINRLLFGAALAPHVLLLQVFDPSILFFGLYMVIEPRTSPQSSEGQFLFAGLVALGAVFLPVVFPSLGVVAALLLGNLVTVAIRRSQATEGTPAGAAQRGRARRSHVATGPAPRWSTGRRAATAFLALLAVGVVAIASVGPSATPSVLVSTPPSSGGNGGGGLGPCTQDNANISASTLTSLHQALGPSVILSYSSSSGTVVFYDPVNQVTVTETDLYEDYGSAEFNGDDFAVSGCSP